MSQTNDADVMRVVLSPVQLAAVLSRGSLSQEATLSNRLWGGLQIVGGVLEMVGAGALCVLPEPTMASKAGCVVFGVHGSDTAATGIRQVWTGQDTATLTQQGTSKLAETLRASPDMAGNIGLSVDIGVSFGVAGALKAVRASSVTLGRINLVRHEAIRGSRIGGHTLEKHVGQTEAQLRARLIAEPDRKAVSTFLNLEMAERAISKVMQSNAMKIKAWSQSSPSYPLVLVQNVGENVGYGVIRKTGEFIPMNKVRVILKCQKYNGMDYYILTSYLEI
ncbi:hypothetical protein FAZ95_24675 [Trinickia violacea]|uniref:Bacterial CdiA-CT RNAse A domain-containing protein n=1 Tax=Trinickia violacea TaxID=2571746 RepID=A0A4P8IVU6_9BURK|nr:RNase A-like domain-containing protein [Trinickia violacea]QCP52377.1 hypothetical protein FAZ95_24675 [Trinickia violacea]